MKVLAMNLLLVCVLPMLVASDNLRSARKAQEVRALWPEISGHEEAYYDRELTSDEHARYLAEYENYYRALGDQLRFLADEKEEDKDDEDEDEGRYLEEEGGEEFEDRRLQQAAADDRFRTTYGGAVPVSNGPVAYGMPGMASTADASASATARGAVPGVVPAVLPAVLPGATYPAGAATANAQASATTRGGLYRSPAGEVNCLGEGCLGFPATGVPAAANAQASASVQGAPAITNVPLSAAEASALATARARFGTTGPIGIATTQGDTITHHSIGENTYATRTVGPGYASSTAMAGSPTGGRTSIRESVADAAVAAAPFPAAVDSASARASANVGNNLLYTPGVAVPQQFPQQANAAAAASANTAAGGYIPAGRPLVNPAGITYYPANTQN